MNDHRSFPDAAERAKEIATLKAEISDRKARLDLLNAKRMEAEE